MKHQPASRNSAFYWHENRDAFRIDLGGKQGQHMKTGLAPKASTPIPPQSDTLKRQTWAKRPI